MSLGLLLPCKGSIHFLRKKICRQERDSKLNFQVRGFCIVNLQEKRKGFGVMQADDLIADEKCVKF